MLWGFCLCCLTQAVNITAAAAAQLLLLPSCGVLQSNANSHAVVLLRMLLKPGSHHPYEPHRVQIHDCSETQQRGMSVKALVST
jgi:hypothetical protein